VIVGVKLNPLRAPELDQAIRLNLASSCDAKPAVTSSTVRIGAKPPSEPPLQLRVTDAGTSFAADAPSKQSTATPAPSSTSEVGQVPSTKIVLRGLSVFGGAAGTMPRPEVILANNLVKEDQNTSSCSLIESAEDE